MLSSAKSRFVTCVAVLATALSGGASPAVGALRARLVAQGFRGVVAAVPDPMFPDTLLVVQTDGLVLRVRAGVTEQTPFLDLRGAVTPPGGEQGLLGMAFPLDAETSGRVFVNFTNLVGNTVVARFTRDAGNPRLINLASRWDLQWPNGAGGRQGFIVQPTFSHNGGHLAFGPDAYLYVGLGDGGGDNDPSGNAQNPTTLLGKMLRVNVSVPDSDAVGYSIPPGNPVFPVAGALPEIWAFGLRNPWRYTFDDLGADRTKALIIGDVGQNAIEELDHEPVGRKGRNYGWRVYEGSILTPNVPVATPAFTPVTPPLFEYTHAVGSSITAGYVYRGTALPAPMRGRLLFGDCIAGRVWSLGLAVDPVTRDATPTTLLDHTTELGGPFGCITSFGRSPSGELYFTDLSFANNFASRVFEIVDDAALPPLPPTNLTAVVDGATVSLTWEADAHGGAVTGYLVEAGSVAGAADLAILPTVGPGLVVPGVANGVYFVRVRASGPAGTSAPTPDRQVVVGCSAPPATPAPPTVLVNGFNVTVGWDVPVGATSTSLEVGDAPGTTFLTIPFGAPASEYHVTAPPGTYVVRVRAANACGTSSPSVERTVAIP